jgi:hypothetical protein
VGAVSLLYTCLGKFRVPCFIGKRQVLGLMFWLCMGYGPGLCLQFCVTYEKWKGFT